LYEETFVLLKPDALERRLVGRIIQGYEDSGLDILDIRYHRRVSEGLIRRHYPDSMAEATLRWSSFRFVCSIEL